MKRSGVADLPLHGGRVPQWLAERMTLLGSEEAERRAWATVNAMHHGGEKPGGGGYGKSVNKEPARKGGRKGGRS